MMHHKINRLKLELDFPSMELAIRSRDAIGESIVGALENAIDEWASRCPSLNTIAIECLELDLGCIYASQQLDLQVKLGQLLEANNQRNTSQIMNFAYHESPKKTDSGSRSSLEIQPAKPGTLPSRSKTGAINSKQIHDLVRHYLAIGSLPWWCDPSQVNLDKLVRTVLQSRPDWLIPLLKSSGPGMLERMIIQFNVTGALQPAELEEIPLGTKEGSQAINNRRSTLRMKLLNVKASRVHLLSQVQQDLLTLTAAISTASKVIISPILLKLSAAKQIRLYHTLINQPLLVRKIEASLLGVVNSTESQRKAAMIKLNNIIKVTSTAQAKKKQGEIALGKTYQSKGLNTHAIHREMLNEERTIITELENLPVLTTEFPETGILVQNAGLVLIAPYLPALFDELRLVKDELFLNKQANYKAVQVLNHLCAQVPRALNNYPLNKVLAGLDFSEPVPGSLRLTKTQKLAVHEMLQAVLGNWGSLRSSSVAALQTNFFTRKGVLKKESDHYTLHVERKDFDLLLDSLPWSFQLIKMRWFDHYFIEVLW